MYIFAHNKYLIPITMKSKNNLLSQLAATCLFALGLSGIPTSAFAAPAELIPLPRITISKVTAPSGCPGAADGSFELTVEDDCGAVYDITANGQVQTAPAGVAVLFDGLIDTLGGTAYPVRIALHDAGACTYDPASVAGVNATAFLLAKRYDLDSALVLVDESGQRVAPGALRTYEGAESVCELGLQWSVFHGQDCGNLTLNATVVSTMAGESAEIPVDLTSDGPTWRMTLSLPIGTNVLTISAEDDQGSISVQTFTLEVRDVHPPKLTMPSDIERRIPSCMEGINVYLPIRVKDCDNGTVVRQTAGFEGPFFTPGEHTVVYTATDRSGNSTTDSLLVRIVQADSPNPILTIDGLVRKGNHACFGAGEMHGDLRGEVLDCNIIGPSSVSPGDVVVSVAGIPTFGPHLIAWSGTVTFDAFSAYFPAGAGQYEVYVSYKSNTTLIDTVALEPEDLSPFLRVTENMVAGGAEACSQVGALSWQVEVEDRCNFHSPEESFTLNGQPAPPFDSVRLELNSRRYFWRLLDQPAGDYHFEVVYTNSVDSTVSATAEFSLVAQPDALAPIIQRPDSPLSFALPACGPDTTEVFFALSAYDNCDGEVQPDLSISEGSIRSGESPGTYIASVRTNSEATVLIAATDAAGNTRLDSFAIFVAQPEEDDSAVVLPIPAPWSAAALGTGQGSAVLEQCGNSSAFALTTTAHQWPVSTDNYQYAYQTACGELSMEVQITAFASDGWQGLFIRNGSGNDGAGLSFRVQGASPDQPSDVLQLQFRRADGAAIESRQLSALAAPYWLRLESGLAFGGGRWVQCLASTDGQQWSLIGSQIVAGLGDCVQLGAAVQSGQFGQAVTAQFAKLSLGAGAGNTGLQSGAASRASAAPFLLYPNPAREQLWVHFAHPLEKGRAYTLLNAMGQTVQQGQLRAGIGEASLDVSGLAAGAYLLRLGGDWAQRFVVGR